MVQHAPRVHLINQEKHNIILTYLGLLLMDWPTKTISNMNTTNNTKMKQIAMADTIVKAVDAEIPNNFSEKKYFERENCERIYLQREGKQTRQNKKN